jgi:hypothetical protein
MTQTIEFELTADHIQVLASLIYEPVPRVWTRGRWCCPFCLELNRKAQRRCSCGIARDAALEVPIAAGEPDHSMNPAQAILWMPDAAARISFSDHRQPPPSAL